jgi:hypothetical protein
LASDYSNQSPDDSGNEEKTTLECDEDAPRLSWLLHSRPSGMASVPADPKHRRHLRASDHGRTWTNIVTFFHRLHCTSYKPLHLIT